MSTLQARRYSAVLTCKRASLSSRPRRRSRLSHAAARTYADAALDAFSSALLARASRRSCWRCCPRCRNRFFQLRRVGPAADIRRRAGAGIDALSATQLDIAIRAAQPVPIQTRVTRQPGQSIYAFVQQHYGRSGKSPADAWNLVGSSAG